MIKAQKYDTICVTNGGIFLKNKLLKKTTQTNNKQTKTKETNMKVKNIAFFGIMAAILGVGGAYAANDTIIASKGYVDAKTAGKQNTLNNGTNVVESGSGNAVTSVTAANGTVTVTKGSSFATADHNHDGTYQPLGNYEETENKLAPNFLTYGGRTYESLSEYLTARFGDNENDKTEFLKKYYPSIGAVQSAVGDAVKMAKMTENGTMTEEATTKVYNSWKEALSNGTTISEQKAFDKYTPTVAAVEKRITDLGLGSAAFTDSSAYATSDHTHSDYETTTHASDTYETKDHAANTYQLKGDYELLDNKLKETTLEGKTLVEYMKDMTEEQKAEFLKDKYPSLAVLYEQALALDGKIPDTSNFLTSSDISGLATAVDNGNGSSTAQVVTYNGQGIVTGGTNAGALATLSEITNDQVAVGAKIVYTKMDSALKDINNPDANTNATCNTANPCVLTYNGDKYVWTNMDLGTNQ